MVAILQTIFFSGSYFDSVFLELSFQLTTINVVSDNGLALNIGQAIVWSNDAQV